MGVQFPLFVFEKDDRSMSLIETPERVLYHLEAIDIENDEYLFWDASGAGVCVSLTRDGIDSFRLCDPPVTRFQRRLKPMLRHTNSMHAFGTISTRYLGKPPVTNSAEKGALDEVVRRLKGLVW